MQLRDVDDTVQIWRGNTMIGYVENGMLYGFDRKGFSVEIELVEHRNQYAAKLDAWRKSKL